MALSSEVLSPTRRDLGLSHRLRYRLQERLTFVAFVAPNFILFAVFVFWPLFYNIYLSFSKWDMVKPTPTMIGLGNYATLLADPIARRVLWNTVYLAAGSVVFRLALGLALAMLLNQKLFARNLYRAIIFSPYFTTGAAVAIVWSWILHKDLGLLRIPLNLVGLPSPNWLGTVQWTIPALIIVTVWRGMGYDMVIYLAGLQGVPADLYESARVDGAGRWALFRHITLPMISPITFFLLVTTILSTLQIFDIVHMMTSGGPMNSSKVIVLYIYENAFKWFNVGYAASLSVALFIIMLVITIIQTRLSARWVHY